MPDNEESPQGKLPTHNGRPLKPVEWYLSNPEFMARAREAYEAIQRGEKGVPFSELKRKNAGS